MEELRKEALRISDRRVSIVGKGSAAGIGLGIILWVTLLVIACVWVYKAYPQKTVIKKYRYSQFLSLGIPFSSRWKSNFNEEDIGIIGEYRKRALVVSYLLFLLPLICCYLYLYFVYAHN